MADPVGQWKERVADAQSRRRARMDGEGKRAFDVFYGRQAADGSLSRNRNGAGKGDAPRPCNSRAMELGFMLMATDLTDEQRKEIEHAWYIARGVMPPDDRPDSEGE